MKNLVINSIGGASGDMLLGLMIDLGGNVSKVEALLKSMLPDDEFQIDVREKCINGLVGKQVHVNVNPHDHQKHHSDHHGHHHHHHHEHNNYSEIKEMINDSDLKQNVKVMADEIFHCIAVAEASVHGTTPEEVHFHEVGALDSIIDIVGFCILFDEQKIDNVYIDSLPIGCGTTVCQHGVIPIPAPATVEILKGITVTQTNEPYELVTPTGAAIIKTIMKENRRPEGNLIASGRSFGHRRLNSRPNLLTAMIIDDQKMDNCSESCWVLETNIDDCSPEILGNLFELLIDAGARDVMMSPVIMKKNRPGHLLSVIVDDAKKDEIKMMIFHETSTFGIREYPVSRTCLERKHVTVKTDYGDVRVKVGSIDGQEITYSPEFEDCRKVANQGNVSIKDVYQKVIKLID